MPGLQTLDVSNNALQGAAGAQALCTLLGAVPGLMHLDVSDNHICEEGAAVLAPVLRGMTCLQTLNLWDTSIGDGGSLAVASTLAALPCFHTLNLAKNWLGAQAMSALQPLWLKPGIPSCELDSGGNRFDLNGAWGKPPRQQPLLQHCSH